MVWWPHAPYKAWMKLGFFGERVVEWMRVSEVGWIREKVKELMERRSNPQ